MIYILLFLILIASMAMATKKDTKITLNKKEISNYFLRVMYCYIGIILATLTVAWITILPIIGVIVILIKII
jgi:hypothetical protein|nr:MAG TPA: hypothetical protein [Caudoviricetes sp.]